MESWLGAIWFAAWLLVACLGAPVGFLLAGLAGWGVRDRRARTDPAALLLSTLALLLNGAVCGVAGPRSWSFWPALVAAALSLLAFLLCLRARFAGPAEPNEAARRRP